MSRIRPEVDEGEKLPETASWRKYQGAITSTKIPRQAKAYRHGMFGLRRPFERQARHRSHTNARPTAAPRSTPSFRASVARPTIRPASANETRWPRRPRAASHMAARPSGWYREKLSG